MGLSEDKAFVALYDLIQDDWFRRVEELAIESTPATVDRASFCKILRGVDDPTIDELVSILTGPTATYLVNRGDEKIAALIDTVLNLSKAHIKLLASRRSALANSINSSLLPESRGCLQTAVSELDKALYIERMYKSFLESNKTFILGGQRCQQGLATWGSVWMPVIPILQNILSQKSLYLKLPENADEFNLLARLLHAAYPQIWDKRHAYHAKLLRSSYQTFIGKPVEPL